MNADNKVEVRDFKPVFDWSLISKIVNGAHSLGSVVGDVPGYIFPSKEQSDGTPSTSVTCAPVPEHPISGCTFTSEGRMVGPNGRWIKMLVMAFKSEVIPAAQAARVIDRFDNDSNEGVEIMYSGVVEARIGRGAFEVFREGSFFISEGEFSNLIEALTGTSTEDPVADSEQVGNQKGNQNPTTVPPEKQASHGGNPDEDGEETPPTPEPDDEKGVTPNRIEQFKKKYGKDK